MKIRNPADGTLIADVATDAAASVRRKVQLARTLTHEAGKPIRRSRNESNGLLSRIDFFLAA